MARDYFDELALLEASRLQREVLDYNLEALEKYDGSQEPDDDIGDV